MSSYFIQVIIPTYNASRTIKKLVDQLETTLKNNNIRIVLVDDKSEDDTVNIIKELAETYNNIDCFFSGVNQGQQASLRTGLNMLATPCDFVITMDDDLQNPVEVTELLIEKIAEGYDLVYGIPIKSMDKPGTRPTILRRAGSHFRDLLFDSFSNKPPGIKVSSFRIMTYQLAEKIASSRKRYFYLSAEAFQYDIKVGNIGYPYVERYYGSSSYTFYKLIKVYLRLLFTYKIKLLK